MTIRFGHKVHDGFLIQVREKAAERQQRLAAIRTPDQARRYVRSVRAKIKACFGPLPDRTPLQTRTLGTLQKNGFRIEKIVFESRPGFPVTANLYVPDALVARAPAVLGLCGHSQNGKADVAYQSYCQGLALKGYVVLILDPISQGERYQFLDVPGAEDTAGRCTREHNMLGKQLALTGEFFGTWRAWDAIRGLDVLLARPEVDRTRIGVTGNSGGGMMTAYIHALDARPTMAAPSCYITRFLRNIENELPTDFEQIPPGILKAGLDIADLLLARAPRPVLILGQKQDFFDPRGTREVYEEVRRIYRLLGAEDRVALFIGPDTHGYSLANRTAMYGFFNRIAGVTASAREPKIEVCPEDELLCVPGGQVLRIKGVRSVHALALERAAKLRANRPARRSAGDLRDLLMERLAIRLPDEAPAYRVLRPAILPERKPAVVFNRFALETGPGYLALLQHRAERAQFFAPTAPGATLYIPHLSAVDELADGLPGATGDLLFGLDVRGIGELRPQTCDPGHDSFFESYGYDYFYASIGYMLGKPVLGGKVFDALCAAQWIRNAGVKQVHLVGCGQGAIVAAMAGLLSKAIHRVTLIHAPESYEAMVRARTPIWPFSSMIPGVLRDFDLPDLYRALAPKKLRLVEPWDARFRSC